MIGRLRGLVVETGDDHLLLDVHGVGYLVFVSTRTLSEAGAQGGEVTLQIETHVREDHIHLYGFLTAEERQWFRLLTSVQGVGAKMAMALQGAFTADQLTQAIAAQDKATLTRAPGVGPRLAERLVTELKNKLPAIYAALPVPQALPDTAPAKTRKGKPTKPAPAETGKLRQEAVSALVNLGYPRVDAFAAVAQVAGEHAEAALDELIRRSLQRLAA